jgi:hypothetical protein
MIAYVMLVAGACAAWRALASSTSTAAVPVLVPRCLFRVPRLACSAFAWVSAQGVECNYNNSKIMSILAPPVPGESEERVRNSTTSRQRCCH